MTESQVQVLAHSFYSSNADKSQQKLSVQMGAWKLGNYTAQRGYKPNRSS